MPFSPRLLWVEDEADACREIGKIGADPGGAERMAATMVCRLVRLSQVPCGAASSLRQEMRALGGDAALARGCQDGSIPTTDVILIGSLDRLHALCGRLACQPLGLPELAADLTVLLSRLDQPATFLAGRRCRLDLSRPRIMGVLNVTPDSFSDGGRHATLDQALRRAEEMVAEGADLIDIGGESTRPGAPAVAADVELARVVPVIEALHREFDMPLSVDTNKAGVARAAVAAGADFVNDISGLAFDPEMAAAVAASGAGLFLMHTRGRPDAMQRDTHYRDPIGEILSYLDQGMAQALAAGVALEKIAIDPGIGFGKDAAGNLDILRRLREFQSLGRPILLGTSRKNFIGKVLNQPEPADRLVGTLATIALGVERGGHIFRVHDVGAARETALMAWAICRGALP